MFLRIGNGKVELDLRSATFDQLNVPFCMNSTAPADEAQPLDLAITPEGLAPWSVSKLKLLEKCPLQFYLKYVKKLKIEEVDSTDDRMLMHIGSALHEVLEHSLKTNDVGQAFRRTRVAFRKSIPKETWQDRVEVNWDNIETFLTRIKRFSERHPIKQVYTEQRLAVTKDLRPARFFDNDNAFFRGVIDLVLELENGDIFIIDHKTGGTTAFGMRNYEFQLDTYKPLFHFGIHNVRRAQAGIHFINEGSFMTGDATPVERIEDDIWRTINFNIECAIDRVIDKGYFFYERNNFCKYCDFAEMCKSGKRGTSGELQKYEDESAEWVQRFLEQKETA